MTDWIYARSFEQFRERVLEDTSLQEELRDVPDRETLVPLLIELGLQHGFAFRANEVETAMDTARLEWMAGSAVL